jgi:hypothetical protein
MSLTLKTRGLRSGFGLPVQVRWFGVPNRYRAEQVSSSGGSVLQYARMHLRVPTCLRILYICVTRVQCTVRQCT